MLLDVVEQHVGGVPIKDAYHTKCLKGRQVGREHIIL
jgi:hypothetical protein